MSAGKKSVRMTLLAEVLKVLFTRSDVLCNGPTTASKKPYGDCHANPA